MVAYLESNAVKMNVTLDILKTYLEACNPVASWLRMVNFAEAHYLCLLYSNKITSDYGFRIDCST